MTLPNTITTSSGLLVTDDIWNDELKANIENLDDKLDGDVDLDGFPVTPSEAPDADYEVANKKYVDDNLTGVYQDKLGLVVKSGSTPDEDVDIDADSLYVYNSADEGIKISDIDITIDNTAGAGVNAVDAGSVAADTWYSLWVITKALGADPAGLAHAGGTGVIGDLTLPTDYTHARFVGWARTDATSDFIAFKKEKDLDRFVFLTNMTLATGLGAGLHQIDVSAGIPPGLRFFLLMVDGPGQWDVRPDINGDITDTNYSWDTYSAAGSVFAYAGPYPVSFVAGVPKIEMNDGFGGSVVYSQGFEINI